MDSKPSDAFEALARIRQAVADADLAAAAAIAAGIGNAPMPPGPRLGEYLEHLKRTLITTKACRAHAQASLARIRAAAEFHRSA